MSDISNNQRPAAATPVDAPPGAGATALAPLPRSLSADEELTFGTLTGFYAPLGATLAMMTVSHAIINGSLNRTSHPELALAAYAVSLSITALSEAPMLMLRQTGAALLRDRAGWPSYVRVATIACLINLAILFAIGWTPLGHVVFHRWLGVKDDLLPAVIAVFRVGMFITLFSTLRSAFHTVLLVSRKTLWITLGMALRLAVMLGLAALFAQTGWLDNGIRGAAIFLAGMATEAVCGFGSFRKWFRMLPEHFESAASSPIAVLEEEVHAAPKPPSAPLTTGRVWTFYLPLVLAALTGSFGLSVTNAGLARMAEPQATIATFAIANVVTYLFVGPLFMLHQVSLFFTGADPKRNRRVARFCRSVGILASAMLGLLAWTQLGDWLLIQAFQSPWSLLPLVKEVLKVSMFMPLIVVWNEYRNGCLLAAGRSRVLTAGKLCNLATLTAAILALVALAPQMGAVASPVASLCGLAVEQLVLYAATRTVKHG